MKGKKLGLAIFFLGAFLVHAYTTLQFLWHAFRIPLAYPLIPPDPLVMFFFGYSAPIGALLMVLGGLTYGFNATREKEAAR